MMSALYIALAAGLLWVYSKKKLKTPYLIAGIGLLIAIDLFGEASKYLNSDNYKDEDEYSSAFKPRPADEQILKDKDPYYRVLDLSGDPYNDAMPSYFHKTIGGYHPAKMEIYQDLIDRHLSKGFNSEVLNMLNTKYAIVGGQGGQTNVIPIQTANGNAWFVNNIKWVNTAEEEISSLEAPRLGDTVKSAPNTFQSKNTAVIRNTFKNDLAGYTFGKDSSAFVKLKQYGLDDISFTSHNTQNGLAVFSDIWYPYGWEAYVDGKQTPIVRADYVLRAIKIPAGNHTIEFHFRPKTYEVGNKISMVSNILVILLCLAALYAAFRKKENHTHDNPEMDPDHLTM